MDLTSGNSDDDLICTRTADIVTAGEHDSNSQVNNFGSNVAMPQHFHIPFIFVYELLIINYG